MGATATGTGAATGAVATGTCIGTLAAMGAVANGTPTGAARTRRLTVTTRDADDATVTGATTGAATTGAVATGTAATGATATGAAGCRRRSFGGSVDAFGQGLQPLGHRRTSKPQQLGEK